MASARVWPPSGSRSNPWPRRIRAPTPSAMVWCTRQTSAHRPPALDEPLDDPHVPQGPIRWQRCSMMWPTAASSPEMRPRCRRVKAVQVGREVHVLRLDPLGSAQADTRIGQVLMQAGHPIHSVRDHREQLVIRRRVALRHRDRADRDRRPVALHLQPDEVDGVESTPRRQACAAMLPLRVAARQSRKTRTNTAVHGRGGRSACHVRPAARQPGRLPVPRPARRGHVHRPGQQPADPHGVLLGKPEGSCAPAPHGAADRRGRGPRVRVGPRGHLARAQPPRTGAPALESSPRRPGGARSGSCSIRVPAHPHSGSPMRPTRPS